MSQQDRIAFQGEPGAYSHLACRQAYPDHEPVPCATFEEAIATVRAGDAKLAMLPVENSTYGRVADIHALLPGSGLFIIGETFVPVAIQLMGRPGDRLEDVTEAMSHTVLLGQCRDFLTRHRIRPVTGADTAGSAKAVSEATVPGRAALASELTTFLFEVRNVPAALYKAMGGFATNGVNMVKLESYMAGGSFTATQFLADIEGHPEDEGVRNAMEELAFFTSHRRVLGVYPAHPYREQVSRG